MNLAAWSFAGAGDWLWFGLIGAVVGSFLNVLVHRLPRMEAGDASVNLFWPGSRCTNCGASIPPWRNIPIFSWLWLRARASCCGARIGARYLLLEVLGFGLFAIFAIRFAEMPWPTLLIGLGGLALAAALLGWVVDAAPTPMSANWSLLWLGLLGAALASEATAAIQAAAVGAALWAPVGWWRHRRADGSESLNWLDGVALMIPGAWFGWAGLPLAVAVAGLNLPRGARAARRARLLLAAGLMMLLLWSGPY